MMRVKYERRKPVRTNNQERMWTRDDSKKGRLFSNSSGKTQILISARETTLCGAVSERHA